MNVESNIMGTAALVAEAPPIIETHSRRPALLYRALVFPMKFFWGMLFCQGLLGSILVVGWTYRLAQRAVLKYWWSLSSRKDGSFADFVAANSRTGGHTHWPNWFCEQNFREAIRRQEGMSTW